MNLLMGFIFVLLGVICIVTALGNYLCPRGMLQPIFVGSAKPFEQHWYLNWQHAESNEGLAALEATPHVALLLAVD